MAASKKSIVLLSAMGMLWYTNLVLLIISVTDFPGSRQLRDYDWLIGILFLVSSACFRQIYLLWKRGRPGVND